MINEKDEYSKVARTYPSVLTLLGFAGILIIVVINNFEKIFKSYEKYSAFLITISENRLFTIIAKIIPLAVLLSLCASALFYFIKLVIREIGKIFPESFIKKIWKIPTTRLLCKESTVYSDETKRQIFSEIKTDYHKDFTKIKNKSIKNEIYTKNIDTVISLIREHTRDNEILLQYNRIYGFWRNFTGGQLLLFLFVCIIRILGLCCARILLITCKQFLGIESLLILLILISTFATFRNGIRYAKQLYTAFLSK